MWRHYYSTSSITDALNLLMQFKTKARVAAGTTDLLLEMERGVRPGVEVLVDISRIPGLDQIVLDENGVIHIGPMVTHNQCAASKLLFENAFPLAKACLGVGSPQIRNRGTIAGNIITASPAADTIPPLMALGARLLLKNEQGERTVDIDEFFTGVRSTILQPDEILVDIFFPAMQQQQKGIYTKFALRRAQAISLVSVAIVLSFADDRVVQASLALGSVAPTVVHAREAEDYLDGKKLDADVVERAGDYATKSARPIDDLRGSAVYRNKIIKILVKRSLQTIQRGEETKGFPEHPVQLCTKYPPERFMRNLHLKKPVTIITTSINGKQYEFQTGYTKTLHHLLREEALLTGTKEGCAEGECGACTIFLDGAAVMSCLVPAPRADGAEIISIEGISKDNDLHPVQAAFIESGAIQCGYCTPGFVMSAVKLLEEKPHPTKEQITAAITGNLCRCTGYYKILQAIELASKKEG